MRVPPFIIVNYRHKYGVNRGDLAFLKNKKIKKKVCTLLNITISKIFWSNFHI